MVMDVKDNRSIAQYVVLIKDPMREIDRIATFLDVRKSEEVYSKVLEKCSFSELKQSYKKRNNRHYIFRKEGRGPVCLIPCMQIPYAAKIIAWFRCTSDIVHLTSSSPPSVIRLKFRGQVRYYTLNS
ncbi:hypothetical protein AM593_05689, partial [Mytilus galloprovincialis]